MERRNGSLAGALLLMGIGSFYLAMELIPEFEAFINNQINWPLHIIGLGALFLLIGLLARLPAFMIPGSIISGIGAMLYYQNMTGRWESWSYAWTFIPGFVGVGLVLFGLLSGRGRAIKAGLINIFIAMMLFGVFGSAFGSMRLGQLIWPLMLVLGGVYLLLRSTVGNWVAARRIKFSGRERYW